MVTPMHFSLMTTRGATMPSPGVLKGALSASRSRQTGRGWGRPANAPAVSPLFVCLRLSDGLAGDIVPTRHAACD